MTKIGHLIKASPAFFQHSTDCDYYRSLEGSIVVEMSHTTVRCNLRVDVTALLLVQVNLRLQDINFFCLTFKLGSEQVFLHLDVALFFLVLIIENVLVIAIKLTVKCQLVFAENLNHVQKVSVPSDSLRKFTLS